MFYATFANIQITDYGPAICWRIFFVAGLKAKKYQLSVKCDTQHTSGETTMQ